MANPVQPTPENLNKLYKFLHTASFEGQRGETKFSISQSAARQVFNALSQQDQAAFAQGSIRFERLKSVDAARLSLELREKHYDAVARIVARALHPGDTQPLSPIQQARKYTDRGQHSLTVEGKGDQTTNPVFFTDGKSVSKSVPPNLAAVIKSRFPDDADSPSHSLKLFHRLRQFAEAGDLSDAQIQTAVRELMPGIEKGYIKGEEEQMIAAIKQAFQRDITQVERSKSARKSWDLSRRLSGPPSPDPSIGTHAAHARVTRDIGQIGQMRETYRQIRDRYVNTAMFAVDFDRICGTHLTPACEEAVLQLSVKDETNPKGIDQKITGIIQEKMTYVPLAGNLAKCGISGGAVDGFMTKHIELIDAFMDLSAFQRAVLRLTELADADTHGGNVALVPKLGEKTLEPITKLNPIQLQTLLNYLKAGAITTDTLSALKEQLIKDEMAGKEASQDLEDQATQKVQSILADLVGSGEDQAIVDGLQVMASADGLRFEIQIFDVDLTMPKNNETSVRGISPPIRNVLLAFPKADEPLTDEVKHELEAREGHRAALVSIAERRFGPEQAAALDQRMTRLADAVKDETLTARGIVWRAVPLNAYYETNFIEAMGDDCSRYESFVQWIGMIDVSMVVPKPTNSTDLTPAAFKLPIIEHD